MKYYHLIIGLLSAIVVSCSVDEMIAPDEVNGSPLIKVFHATIEDQPEGTVTKTFADEQLRVLWNKDDRITIFNDATSGVEYYFAGDDSDTGGDFYIVEKEEGGAPVFSGGSDLGGNIYAIYPYKEDTKISHDGEITFTLPDKQSYHYKSFGIGDNTMVAKSTNTTLKFKNVGGYLSFRLYGDDVTVSSIILEANGGQALSGKGKIVVNSDGLPVVTMDANASSKVKLNCGDLKIGTSEEEYTEFWIVVPPVDFSKATGGFTVTVTTPDGGVFIQDAPIDLSIKRNAIRRMAPLKVVPDYSGNNIKINGISSNYGGYGVSVKDPQGNIIDNTANYDESTRTFTITIPTVTDFSELVLNYDLVDGDVLMVGDQIIESGVTKIDASQPVTLKVFRGYAEMRYTLVAQNTGLPVVRINTTNFDRTTVESDRVYVQSSGWGQRTKIDERIWRPSDYAIKYGSDTTALVSFESSDGTEIKEYSTQIKGRGNATWKYNKRPYALKLAKKQEVFGMPKHKRWVLLANWKDRTLLRNDAAFWLSKQTALPYTVNGLFVELEFNGEHRGNYYLCEQIKIDGNRVNIQEWAPEDTGDITGGFMMEIDNNFDEANKFKSSKYRLKYMFKDPDEDLTDAAVNYMKNFINNLETKIQNASNGEYREDFDIDAAIWFMFVNELTGNGDFYNENFSDEYKGPHSTYLYKDKGGKLTMGPVWDFDYLTFMPERDSKWAGADQSGYYYKSLIKDSVFKERLRELWSDYQDNIAGFDSYIDLMADKIALSEQFNTAMWGYSNTSQDQGQNKDNELSFEDAVSLMKTAFAGKKSWMDDEFKKQNFAFE